MTYIYTHFPILDARIHITIRFLYVGQPFEYIDITFIFLLQLTVIDLLTEKHQIKILVTFKNLNAQITYCNHDNCLSHREK